MREECITLPAKAGIQTVAALRQEMLGRLAALDTGDSLVLDFGSLEKFDTSLGQLIVSLKKTAAAKGLSLAFRNVEPHKTLGAMLNCDTMHEAPAGGPV